MIIYDEKKRQANLIKHGLDLANAHLVYDAPGKIALCSLRRTFGSFHCDAPQKRRGNAMTTSSKTDWDRVKREADADAPITPDAEDLYNPNDEEAVDAFFDQAVVKRRGERGPQKTPVKERVSLRLSSEVVDYFKAGGSGWQTRLDQALKEYVSGHPRG
jgi:uncharacterized protein (DUF4415 family)